MAKSMQAGASAAAATSARNGKPAAPRGSQLHPTQHDLSATARGKLVTLLAASLADATDLSSQAKQAHWNVKGPNFIALHELFDTVYVVTAAHIDLLAERIVQLGGQVHGTVRASAAASRLPEYPLDITDEQEHVQALSAALARCAKTCRQAIDQTDKLGDMASSDLFTVICQELDKHLWFVEAHLG